MNYRLFRSILFIPISIFANTNMLHLVEHAFDYRSDLRSAREIILFQKHEEWAELSGYFPQIHVDFDPQKTNVQPPVGHLEANVAIEQLVYSAAGPYQRYKIAIKSTEIAQLREQLKENQIQYEVEHSMLDRWVVQQQKAYLDALDQAAYTKLSQAKKRYVVALLSDTELLHEERKYAQISADIKSYDNDIDTSLFAVNRMLERPTALAVSEEYTAQFVAENIEKAYAITLDSYIHAALGNRKELAIKDIEIEQLRMQEAYEKRFYMPTIKCFLYYSKADPFFTAGTFETVIWQVGVTFAWDFDGFKHAHHSKAVDNQYLSTIFEKTNLQQSIKLEVQVAYNDLQKMLKQLEAAQIKIKQQKQNYASQKKRSQIGLVSPVEMAQAQYEWEQAQFDLEQLELMIAKKNVNFFIKAVIRKS